MAVMREPEIDRDPAERAGRLANSFKAVANSKLVQILMQRQPGIFAKRAAKVIDRYSHFAGNLR